VKKIVHSGEENCASLETRKNPFYISMLIDIGEEICALPVKRFVQKGLSVSFQRVR
jgi:hypothetical protein